MWLYVQQNPTSAGMWIHPLTTLETMKVNWSYRLIPFIHIYRNQTCCTSFDMSDSTSRNATLKSIMEGWHPTQKWGFWPKQVDMFNEHLKPVQIRAITGHIDLFWRPELTWLQWTSGSLTQRRAFAILTWFKPSNFKPFLKKLRTHEFTLLTRVFWQQESSHIKKTMMGLKVATEIVASLYILLQNLYDWLHLSEWTFISCKPFGKRKSVCMGTFPYTSRLFWRKKLNK